MKQCRAKRSRATLCVFLAAVLPITGYSATAIEPDIKVGASYLQAESVSTPGEVNEWGGNVDARVNFLWFDERSRFVITPKVKGTSYSDNESEERENISLGLGWTRDHLTADSSLRVVLSRQDLVTSEFGDISLDPDDDIGVGDGDSGIVGNGDRDRLQVNGEFAKNLSTRGDLVLGLNYLDNTFNEDGPATRVDYSEGIASLGWRWKASERTVWTFSGGARKYEGDNSVDVDSSKFEARFDLGLTENSSFYAGVGYEDLDGQQGTVDLGSDDSVPFQIGFARTSELGRVSIDLARYVNANSTGQFEERTRLTVLAERNLSERLTGAFGVAAYRGNPLGIGSTNTERDYFSGRLELYWAVARKWYLGIEFYHSQQDVTGSASNFNTKSRSEVLLNVRYRGQNPSQI